MQADIEAELAARAVSDLIIGSECGSAGADLELGLIVNSSDSADLDLFGWGSELTAAAA